jgi:transcription antitermination factor NusG
MPILARELDMFPEDLLERPSLGREPNSRWWAMYTKSRHEKELMRRLRGLNIPFYTPLIPRSRRSASGRTRTAYVALFAGYVFMYGGEDDRTRALTTNCVSRWLLAPNSVELTQDLRHMHRLIESGAPLSPEARLEPGTRVRVRSGPLAGIGGIIIQRQGCSRLYVAVNFLQQGASLLIEDHEVERCE